MPVGPLKVLGKKHVELLSHWAGTAIVYGTASAVGITYFTDWKAVLKYVPYYGGKYSLDDDEIFTSNKS